MGLFYLFVKIAILITPIIGLIIISKLDHLINVTKQNKNTIMATLQDFQNLVSEIETATTNISTYVQGTGMSAADQEAALTIVHEAVTKLVAAVPQVTAPAEPSTQPAQ